jgi:hypothetical protein
LLGYSGHFDEDVIEQVRRHPDVSQSIVIHLNAPCRASNALFPLYGACRLQRNPPHFTQSVSAETLVLTCFLG